MQYFMSEMTRAAGPLQDRATTAGTALCWCPACRRSRTRWRCTSWRRRCTRSSLTTRPRLCSSVSVYLLHSDVYLGSICSRKCLFVVVIVVGGKGLAYTRVRKLLLVVICVLCQFYFLTLIMHYFSLCIIVEQQRDRPRGSTSVGRLACRRFHFAHGAWSFKYLNRRLGSYRQ